MRTETDPDYITADRILEDGDSRWFRQRIAYALRAAREVEREACAKVATGVHDHADCGHGEGYMNGRPDAAAAIRAQS